ncbi:hypothetical protein WR25_13215 [Diploscapter pachys]|uniref:Uncharacterized protein n=1 Tax=Diploscapter pachys TaxID=2018661 RepID=A0A2A2L5M7_9BILA|nr:hypothetical protein WR25_01334 [Diploscapter pachys]PAV81438.1 hypothetical protein WR25_13215 [Diploscapter pachys]
MRENDVELVSCRTICLTIYQDLYVWGQPTGERLFVRGCALTLAKRGISNHTLSMLDRRDMCRDMNAAELFRNEYPPDPQRHQRVHVCSCLGDRCNGALSSSGLRCNSLLFLFPVIAVLALFL